LDFQQYFGRQRPFDFPDFLKIYPVVRTYLPHRPFLRSLNACLQAFGPGLGVKTKSATRETGKKKAQD